MLVVKRVRCYPRSIEFDENVLCVVENNVVIVVGYDNGDWTFLSFRNRFTLDARRNISFDISGNELLNFRGSDFLGLVIRELLVLCDILNSKCWPLFLPILLAKLIKTNYKLRLLACPPN